MVRAVQDGTLTQSMFFSLSLSAHNFIKNNITRLAEVHKKLHPFLGTWYKHVKYLQLYSTALWEAEHL